MELWTSQQLLGTTELNKESAKRNIFKTRNIVLEYCMQNRTQLYFASGMIYFQICASIENQLFCDDASRLGDGLTDDSTSFW